MSNKYVNKLQNSTVGSVHGGDDNSRNQTVNINGVEERLSLLYDIDVMESFSERASEQISNVVEALSDAYKDEDVIEDEGFDEEELLKKFTNMKCSQRYKDDFEEASDYFHVIDDLKKKDQAIGGALTVRRIISIIGRMYDEIIDLYDTGHKIHNVLVHHITALNKSDDFFISTNIIVYYIVRSCGIFNEKK